MFRLPFCWLSALILCLYAFSLQASSALPVLLEQEPNDEPLQGEKFTAPILLSGVLPKSGDQDAFRWQVSDADAQRLWTVKLIGMPAALTGVTLVTLQLDEAGQAVTSKKTLLNFGIRDGSKPITQSNLLLPAGEVIAGVFGAGQTASGFQPPGINLAPLVEEPGTESELPGDGESLATAYRVSIELGDRLLMGANSDHATRATAISVRPKTARAFIAAGTSWYQITVPKSDSPARYTVTGGIELGRQLQATLFTESGAELSSGSVDRRSQFVLPNLALVPGNYYLELKENLNPDLEKSSAVRWLSWTAVGEVVEGEEREPNPYWPQANHIDHRSALTARMDKSGDADFYQIQMEAADAQQVWDFTVKSGDLERLSLCLLDSSGVKRQCRSGKPPLMLPGLVLNPGVHGVLVERSTSEGNYELAMQPTGALARNSEQEPNDKAADASVFGKRRLIKGTLSAQDKDEFLLFTTEKAQLWRMQAIGTDLVDLRYLPQHGGAGVSVRAGSSSRRLRLDNLFLLPGQHRFSLSARADTQYVLRALPLGPPNLFVEREPNNTRNTAHGMTLNQKSIAMLTETTDRDYFRWYLGARQAVQLSLRGAPDAGYVTKLYHDGGHLKSYVLTPGELLKETLWLDPGDYYFEVTSNTTSDAEYEVQVDQLAEPLLISDREPNDTANTAAPWPQRDHLQGHLGASRASSDWYRLPPRQVAQTWVVPKVDKVQVRFVNADRKVIAEPQTDANGVTRVILPPSLESYLYLYGKGEYDFFLQTQGQTKVLTPAPLPVQLEFKADATKVAAFVDSQQLISGKLLLRNESAEDLRLELAGTTTDDRWQLNFEQSTLKLAAGAEQAVPVRVLVGPDAWPDEPVHLRVVAQDQQQRVARVEHSINAVRRIPAVAPEYSISVPAELRGHINIASAARGARWRADAEKYKPLNDGILALGQYFRSTRNGVTGPAVNVPVLELAGGKPVAVTGFSLHAFGLQDGEAAQRNARGFEISLSQDGVSFTPVLTAQLQPHNREQFFVLPNPRSAQFARLELLTGNDNQLLALGEWKVLAAQDPTAGSPVNLADPAFGGHVVHFYPALPNYGHLQPILIADDRAARFRIRSGVDTAWVIGFHHNRAARIGRIEWKTSPSGRSFKSTRILVSEHSPLGPWVELDNWAFDPAAGAHQVYSLEQPVWARFIKFDVPEGAAGEWVTLPDQIQIVEAPDENGSILGEWGYDESRGPFELTQNLPVATPVSAAPAHQEPSRARLLVPGQSQQGLVQLGEYENWYQVDVPEGHNTLGMTLSGSPVLRVEATLLDIDNQTIELRATPGPKLPNIQTYAAKVEPGRYRVRVAEAPRSVVFTWDTSGSTAQVRPIIRQALMNYVQDVKPGLDEAHMLPFGGGFLSRAWLNEPYLLQSVLNDYNGAGNSSAAETALVRASAKLQDRPGQRVIVLITDAATSTDTQLWQTMSQVHPRVIALGVSSKGAFGSKPLRERDLMQDWAMVGGGYYEYVENVGSMARAFDRASSKIREPAAFGILVDTAFTTEPEPGLLQVIRGKEGEAVDISLPARSLEIVLDASGSMLQRLDGKRRYQIARSTLHELINKHLPIATNVALRVFGAKEAGTCQTELAMPFAPLDRSKAKKVIDQIVPKNLAKTPIAASLAAAAKDMANAPGEKIVLLITDGEETCEGDVDASIELLAGAGVEAVVNVIGFAVDDSELILSFERWARNGNGVFRSALDQSSLIESAKQLTNRTYSIINADGERIAEGIEVGESIPLRVGTYTLEFSKNSQISVAIKSGETRQVTL